MNNRERERVILASPSYQDIKNIISNEKTNSSIINIDEKNYGEIYKYINQYFYPINVVENNKTYFYYINSFITVSLHSYSTHMGTITNNNILNINKSSNTNTIIYRTYPGPGFDDRCEFLVYPNLRILIRYNENNKNSNSIPSLKEYIKENYKDIYDKYMNTYYSGDK